MELPYFLFSSVDHELLIWDQAYCYDRPFRAVDTEFFRHEHDGPIFPRLPLQLNGKDLLQV